ncbi:DUF6634 family protein [Methylobacterium sp. 1030]|uniref:DUF6634 family protein n=1 Tax=Methylobacterium sp. 1030 TaxID=3156404 RepID=UPI0033976968
MVIGFAGATGRTDASHAALLAARTIAMVEGRATLLLDDPAAAPAGDETLDVMAVRPTGRGIGPALRSAIEASRGEGRSVVLDLAPGLLGRTGVRAFLDVSVAVVGPHEADERRAAGMVRDRGADPAPWYLGCRRAGGAPAAARFASAMAELAPNARVLPFALPPMGRGEAAALGGSAPRGRTLRSGLLLLAALREAMASPVPARFVPLEAAALDEQERIAVAADVRSLPDRLRDLADDIEAVEAGFGPTQADLVGAPVLDGWSYDAVASPILKGRVSGHPCIAEGHRARTSEVFLTDRATWARTLSRWYVLRAPEGAPTDGLH